MAEEQFLHPFVLKKSKIAYPVLNKAFLQPAKTTAMCTACREYADPPPPSHLFCYYKTYLQNGLHQLITCCQSCMTSILIISGQRVS